MLHEEVASQPQGACGDMLVLPIYAALPPELQVSPPRGLHPPTTCPLPSLAWLPASPCCPPASCSYLTRLCLSLPPLVFFLGVLDTL